MNNPTKIAALIALALALTGNQNCEPCPEDPVEEDAAPDEIAPPPGDDDDAADDDDAVDDKDDPSDPADPVDDDDAPQTPDCECDAAINKTPGESLTPGGQGSWMIQVEYFGAEWCEDGNLCIEDTLPAGLTFAGWNGSAWSCTSSGSTVECCFTPTLPTAATSLLPLEILVDVDSTLEGEVENCADLLQGDDYFDDAHEGNNSSCATAPVPCGDLDESLNTGFDDASASPAAPGSLADDWTLIVDPAGGVVPRAPFAVNAYGGWLPAMTNSSWLSPTTDGFGGAGNTWIAGTYTYERCFCLEEGFSAPTLDLQLRADDAIAAVRLNGSALAPIAGTSGTFNDPATLDFLATDPAAFQAGENCVQVDVLDTWAVATGLDAVGFVFAEDGLCCEEERESDLAITKTSEAAFIWDQTGTYTFDIENQGTATEATVTVTDPLPADVTFVSNTNPDWACTAVPLAPPQVLTCTYSGAPLAPGDTTSFDITVQVVAEAASTGVPFLSNCAQVSGASVDVDPSDNLSCIETPVGCGDLDDNLGTGFDNDANAVASLGDLDDDWTVVVDPMGGVVPRPADVVTYPGWLLPMGSTQWISTTTTGPGMYYPQSVEGATYTYERCWCMEQASSVSFSAFIRADNQVEQVRINGVPITAIGGVGTHATAPLEYLETNPGLFVPGENCIQIDALNWGSVAGINVEASIYAEGADCCAVEEPEEADLEIVKSHVGNFVYGTQNQWTMDVTNWGPADATGMVVMDTLAPGYTFVGNTNLPEWSCAATALPPQVVTCAYIGAPLPAGWTTSFDLIVEVDRVQDWPNNGDLIVNCADVTGDQPDPDPTNNQSCDPTIQVI